VGRASGPGNPEADNPWSEELEIERQWCLLARLDHEHLGKFFEKYHRPILGYLQHRVGDRDIAEDLTSETFLAAVDGFWRFRFRGVSFGAWLFQLARGRLGRYYRKRQNRQDVSFVEGLHDPVAGSDVQERLEGEQDRQLLALCLRELDPENQDLLALHYWGGLTLAQTATVMKMKTDVVKARHHRARRRLAKLLSRPEIRDRLSREGRRALDELRLELLDLELVGHDEEAGA
jgi:RNA polymerase sigma-70 factor (ECF subfamily)